MLGVIFLYHLRVSIPLEMPKRLSELGSKKSSKFGIA